MAVRAGNAQRSRRWTIIIGLCFAAPPQPARARFLHEDADEVDREEGLRSEATIDKLSYRQTWHLRHRWLTNRSGYQVGVGSTDANNFDMYEYIKLLTNGHEPVGVGFMRKRREDVVSQRTEDEVRIQLGISDQPAFIAILGDGGALKKWGDLGIAAGISNDWNQIVEAYFYSVDHYYSEKEADFPDDRYVPTPWSAGLRGQWRLVGGGHISGEIGHDRPFRWERPSRGYIYDYARSFAEADFESAPVGSIDAVRLRLSAERKYEHQVWSFQLPESSPAKTGIRRALEAGVETRFGSTQLAYRETGLAYVQRDVQYENYDLPERRGSIPAWPSPGSHRHEILGFYLSNSSINGSPRHFFQRGVFTSRVRVDREFEPKGFGGERRLDTLEVKGHTAWEFLFSANGSLFVNANWNLDRLAYDFPFQDRPPRPWNGGNLQLQVVF